MTLDNKSDVKAKVNNKNIILYYKNKIILTGIIETIVSHCPEQAYISVSEKCIFNCKFCSVPIKGTKKKTKEEILQILEKSSKKKEFKAISLTSGVFSSPEKDFEYLSDLISFIKEKYKKQKIGVSIVPFRGCSSKLKSLGVDEVKYNIETFNYYLFKSICSGLKYNIIIKELIEAVSIFGKGHVFTNIIIGLGETNDMIKKGIEYFAKHGIITNLRPITPQTSRLTECTMERPTKERLMDLYKIHKKILSKYDLINLKSYSMCSLCGGCDLTPQTD